MKIRCAVKCSLQSVRTYVFRPFSDKLCNIMKMQSIISHQFCWLQQGNKYGNLLYSMIRTQVNSIGLLYLLPNYSLWLVLPKQRRITCNFALVSSFPMLVQINSQSHLNKNLGIPALSFQIQVRQVIDKKQGSKPPAVINHISIPVH